MENIVESILITFAVLVLLITWLVLSTDILIDKAKLIKNNFLLRKIEEINKKKRK